MASRAGPALYMQCKTKADYIVALFCKRVFFMPCATDWNHIMHIHTWRFCCCHLRCYLCRSSGRSCPMFSVRCRQPCRTPACAWPSCAQGGSYVSKRGRWVGSSCLAGRLSEAGAMCDTSAASSLTYGSHHSYAVGTLLSSALTCPIPIGPGRVWVTPQLCSPSGFWVPTTAVLMSVL
jgi:hypothetical protein